MTRHQAHRVRIDGIWIGLAAMIASAVLVIAAIWLGLTFLFSLADYIPSSLR